MLAFQGLWYGIELDRPVGKNDGSVNGRCYFICKPKCGVFAPPTRVQRLGVLLLCVSQKLLFF